MRLEVNNTSGNSRLRRKKHLEKTQRAAESRGSGRLLPLGLGRGSQRIGYSFIAG